MYSTKTATINNNEFVGSYMPVGINDNVNLKEVNVRKTEQGRDFIEFVFVNAQGQTSSFSEWKNDKTMWVKTDEELQRRDDQQFGRILQIINCFYDETPEFEGNSFVEMINWVKSKLDQFINSNLPKKDLRIKVVYDKKGYTKVSTLGTFVEPMSVEESQIKLWKNDLLERPVVADKEDDPLVAAANEALLLNTPVTETTGADDLPF